MIAIDGRLPERLREEVGDALRVIGTYDGSDYEMHYLREDVQAEYRWEEFGETFSQIGIEGMGYSHFQDLFRIGEMNCAIYGFEEAFVFHFPHDDFNGLVVSVDSDVQLNPHAITGKALAAMP